MRRCDADFTHRQEFRHNAVTKRRPVRIAVFRPLAKPSRMLRASDAKTKKGPRRRERTRAKLDVLRFEPLSPARHPQGSIRQCPLWAYLPSQSLGLVERMQSYWSRRMKPESKCGEQTTHVGQEPRLQTSTTNGPYLRSVKWGSRLRSRNRSGSSQKSVRRFLHACPPNGFEKHTKKRCGTLGSSILL